MIYESEYFTGDNALDDAFAKIRKYFSLYPPQGYCTEATISYDITGIKVRFSRLESCD